MNALEGYSNCDVALATLSRAVLSTATHPGYCLLMI